MFICQICHVTIGPRIPPIMKVVETRKVEYESPLDVDGMEQEPTYGREIAKEIRVCAGCALDL